MTMRQLATLAGVSVSTVSKAFSGSREVSKAQREKIFALAKENDCFDKYNKLSFEKYVIAVVGPEFQSHYYAHQLSMLEKEIQRHGGLMVTGCYNFDVEERQRLVTYFVQYAKVNGIIVYGSLPPAFKNNLPMVVIGQSDVCDSISLSWKASIRDVVALLLENGHQDIAFIGENYTDSKKDVFLEMMQQYGIPVQEEYVISTEKRFERAGYAAMNQLLSLERIPTAVLAAYDSIAIGAMKSIYEHGLKIPEDISLIGMDDIKSNPYFDVPLTSVTSYNEDLCEIAVDMLFDRINKGNASKIKTVSVSAELVLRDSVGRAKERKC